MVLRARGAIGPLPVFVNPIRGVSVEPVSPAGELLALRYVRLGDALAMRWPGNPKRHDIPALATAILEHGFRDPSIYDGTLGAIPAGNGRLEALEYIRGNPELVAECERRFGAPYPFGVGVDEAGEWCVPLVFGADAQSQAAAEAFGVDHNNLTLGGAGFEASEIARLWNTEDYAALLRRLKAEDALPLTAGEAEVADLLAAVDKAEGTPASAQQTRGLFDRFIVPPFSVLDARAGYWQERKDRWLALGLAGHETREAVQGSLLSAFEAKNGRQPGPGENWITASVFDPVLCELIYRWFTPPGGTVLDPFAGGISAGAVAGVLGYAYTGIELRPEQVAANDRQWGEIAGRLGDQVSTAAPRYLLGDSAKLDQVVPSGELFDLVWSDPPYYDLERYSSDQRDGSGFGTYDEFMTWYRGVYAQAVSRLKDDRFLAIKVGEIRDRRGVYRNFVGDTIRTFIDLGLAYYNEAVLITMVGTLALRTGKPFAVGRKLGKSHQNVLIFYKGDPSSIRDHFPEAVEHGAFDDGLTGNE